MSSSTRRHTALVVVDMQRDFCTPEGAFARAGVDISMYPPMVPRLVRLVDGARTAGVRVVYILMTVLPGGASDSPAQIRFNMRMQLTAVGGAALTYTADGSEGQRLIPELDVQDGDLVVKKYRSSGFWGTNLDMLLRSNGIKTVVVTGCTTEGCVESTARDALFNDYYVVLAEDCVASDDRAQHDASLFLMRHRFDVAGADAIMAPVGASVKTSTQTSSSTAAVLFQGAREGLRRAGRRRPRAGAAPARRRCSRRGARRARRCRAAGGRPAPSCSCASIARSAAALTPSGAERPPMHSCAAPGA